MDDRQGDQIALTFWRTGRTTSSTIARPPRSDALALRLNDDRSLVGEVDDGDWGGSSLLRAVPTYSAESLREPMVSTFFTGLIVSTPEPKSASRITVPAPVVLCLAAHDERFIDRTEPV